jgi:hypothetical protein
MNLLPVSPLLSPDGNLVSLVALRGALNAAPVALDAGAAIGNVAVSTEQISVSVGAKLGVGSIFASSIQANETGFWMDAMEFADSAIKQDATNIVSQTRWGYGLRILCRAQQLDASFKLNFAVLGAAVDLGLATVSYEVQTIGLGPTALAAILDGLSQFGALNGDTFHDLNSTVIQNLSKIIANPPAVLTPRPIAVQLNIPVELDPVVKARSEVFAMRRLRDGMSLTDALARAGAKYDTGAIRAVYQKVAPGVADNAAPGPDAEAFAKQWMG